MKSLAVTVAVLCMSACASQLTFIEQTTGLSYSGQMQGSFSEEGRISANIEDVVYEGTWAIENSASAIKFGKVKQSDNRRVTQTPSTEITFGNPVSYPDTVVEFARIKDRSASFLAMESYAGSGRIVLKSAAGDELLCSFEPGQFETLLRGFCARDDGVFFDLFTKG